MEPHDQWDQKAPKNSHEEAKFWEESVSVVPKIGLVFFTYKKHLQAYSFSQRWHMACAMVAVRVSLIYLTSQIKSGKGKFLS